MRYNTDDLRIVETKELVSPAQIVEQFPVADTVSEVVHDSRLAIHRILSGEDDRLLAIVGPCSIHDVKAAVEFATRLKELRIQLRSDLEILMRVYFEKPRTTIGWKGLINDPDLDESFHINKGLVLAREFLIEVNEMGLPAGTEYLDLISPQYIADLVSWGAIGARTTESQGHRQLASGLSCPVGFKNGTDGNLAIAVDAVNAASYPHHFLSVTKEGRAAIFSTAGNKDCHIILRGGTQPNYDAASVQSAAQALEHSGLGSRRIMIDFSHANSRKQPRKQAEVGANVIRQLADGENRVMGVMIESHLVEGRQDVMPGRNLAYGRSITDACMGWDDTAELLERLAESAKNRRARQAAA
ncbi:MAG: Phospho-2-dehydro-3-deoxyheptonate aldolase, Phe-sensitive [Gammaproteobacteria bacterium]|nr:Phospho-2-dehydro-3-deoxyheptonate aldolase, Phe-sensitive [Gammaproteobacteria bacterium]